jgi:hypothetical protein
VFVFEAMVMFALKLLKLANQLANELLGRGSGEF